MEILAGGRDDIRIYARRSSSSLPREVGVELVAIFDRAGVSDLDVRAKRLKRDVVLRQQGLVLPETVDQVTLGNALLPSTRGLGGYNTALGADLDAIGTRLLDVTSNLALLAKHATMPARDLDNGRVRIWWGIGHRRADRSCLIVG